MSPKQKSGYSKSTLLISIHNDLLRWFSVNARTLPWRQEQPNGQRDPYATWVSETMLQQTRVESVIEKFQAWMQRFPTVKDLANAPLEDVLLHWQGLGYYSRARNLHLAAQRIITQKLPDTFPITRKDWLALPGVGEYTAGAVLSLAMHQKEALLDGNLVRIFCRLFALPGQGLQEKSHRDVLWNVAKEFAQLPQTHLTNESLMEFGALLCTPQSPQCDKCPLADRCIANQQDRVHEFPAAKKKWISEVRKGWIQRIYCQDKILLIQCSDDLLKGQWRLPWKWDDSASPLVLKHQITRYKLQFAIMDIEQKDFQIPSDFALCQTLWVPVEKAADSLPNSLSLKALRSHSSQTSSKKPIKA